MSKSKNRKEKIGPKTSAYRLYVEFLPQFQLPHKSFNYFSDDWRGKERGLEDLLRRVLHGTCKGKYIKAMLHETESNLCLKVFLPNKTLTFQEYEKEKVKYKFKRAKFKAYLILKKEFAEKLEKAGKRHPVIISILRESREEALEDLELILQSNLYKGKIEKGILYAQEVVGSVGKIIT